MNVEHEFLNICKICKKVYKDKGGLLEHQKQQHSIFPQQQIINMNRLHKDQLNRKGTAFGRNFGGNEGFRNGDGATKNIQIETSYARLQKPPASLKPKLQCRGIQQEQEGGGLSKKASTTTTTTTLNNGSTTTKSPFDFVDDNEGEADEWKKWEPEKEIGGTIITASVAQSTADCYSPTGQSITKPFADIGKVHLTSAPADHHHQYHHQSISANTSVIKPPIYVKGSPDPLKLPYLSQQEKAGNMLGGNKGGPSVNYKPALPKSITNSINGIGRQGNVLSSSGIKSQLPGGAGLSINKTGTGPRIPIPKLMSKTKAQFQILKSQATRPKILPRSSVNNALPRVAGGDPVPTTTATPSPPKLTRQADLPQTINQERFPNPPQLLREQGANKSIKTLGQKFRSSRGGGRLPPQRTNITTPNNSPPMVSSSKGRGGGRVSQRGRGGLGAHAVLRRESLHTPSGSDSSDNSVNCSGGNSSDSDSYSSPPPKKLAKMSTSKASQSLRNVRNVGDDEEERIFGKDYKCPPVTKVASYLNKKGVRVWICLVCEQTEEEISGGPMICCDTCEDWYHFTCVGIDDEPPEHEKWYCKRCIYKNLQTKLQKSKKPVAKKGRGISRRGKASKAKTR